MFLLPLPVLALSWSAKTLQVQPFFIKSSLIWARVDLNSGKSPLPFGRADSQVERDINRIIVGMNDRSFVDQTMTDRSATAIGKQIVAKVESIEASSGMPNLSDYAKQWYLAEGVCEFVRATCLYDHTNREQNQPASVQIAHNTFDYIYKIKHPSAVCWGIAVCVRDIARGAGLECDFVNGISRSLGSEHPKQSDRNHGVVVFTFPGGNEVPADVSSNICDFQNNRKPSPMRKTNSWMVLPRRPEAWEVFLATFNADVGEDFDISGDKQNRHKLLKMSFSEWASVDTSYLQPLQNWLANQEK